MPLYRKKPVTVIAHQWKGGAADATLIIQWILDAGGTARYHEEERIGQTSYRPDDVALAPECIVIDTLEGSMHASRGDFVIQGVQGEFYPCKPDIFEATYESA